MRKPRQRHEPKTETPREPVDPSGDPRLDRGAASVVQTLAGRGRVMCSRAINASPHIGFPAKSQDSLTPAAELSSWTQVGDRFGVVITGREQSYSTEEACDGAIARGFDLSLADWRAVFLAMTDTLATDGEVSLRSNITARFIGPVRDGERWTIFVNTRSFDALYDKHKAVVYRVIDTPSARVSRDPVKGPLISDRALVIA